MAEEVKTSTGAETGSLCGRYTAQIANRHAVLSRAWDCAELTIPSLLPRAGHSSHSALPTPWQSVGAEGVNNLSSRLLMTSFPANHPFFRHKMDEAAVAKLMEGGGTTEEKTNHKTLLDAGLAAQERAVMTEIETSGDRVSLFETFKHLLVVGNVLLHDSKKGLRVYHLDHYVVRRDPSGNALEMIAFEQVDPVILPAVFQDLAKVKAQERGNGNADAPVDMYTQVLRTNTEWTIKQEVCGQIVPETEGTYPLDECPWIPLRFAKIDGENYGRSYVEEYLGDFRNCEHLSQALTEGAEAAALLILLCNPNGSTSKSALAKAKNGDVINGKMDEVGALQSGKAMDFSTAEKRLAVIENRLQRAFLLNTATQRNGDRVTAEEIRYMAQELESILGGFYTILSKELQLPYVKSKMAQMRKRGALKTLPKDIVKPSIITGMDAMGRDKDGQTLKEFMVDVSTTFGPDNAALYINVSEGITRLATSRGIDTKNLVNSSESVNAQQEQRRQDEMMNKLGPQAISAGGKLAGEAMKSNGQGSGSTGG